MSLRRRQREHTVQVILEAASTVFAEKGFHGTSMEDVAQAVGCAPATLYGYFKGKGELFTRLVTDAFDDYLDGVERVLASNDGFLPAFEAWFAHFIEWQHRNEGISRLLLSLFRSGERSIEPDREAKEAHERRHLAAICQLTQRGLDEGLLRPVPAISHAISLISLMHGHFFASLLGMQGGTPADVCLLVRHQFLDGAAVRVSPGSTP